MKTDKQLFQIFAVQPQWLFELAGLPTPGACSLLPFTLKSLEREADGIVVPVDATQPITVVEFQFQRDERIYTRLVTEMAAAQEAHAMRPVQGLILFGRSGHDPQTPPWSQIVRSVVLKEVLPEFARTHTGHPLASVFQPLVEENLPTLETQAAGLYRVLRGADLDERHRDVLLGVFADWLGQRFPNKHKRELEMIMIEDLPPVEETVWGREFIELGEKRGEKRGAELALNRAVQVCLKVRFPPVPKELSQQIRQLQKSQKEQLLEFAMRAKSLEAVEKWIARHSAKSPE